MSSTNTRRLKILLTVHCFFPRHYHGTERYTLDLAKCLQRFGHEVVVVTPNRYDEDATLEEWREYEFEGVRVIALDITHFYPAGITHTYYAPHHEDSYRRILAQERPDIVHCCHLLYLGVNFITVAKSMGLPVILSLTDFFGICWTNTLTTIGGVPCSGPGLFSTNCVRDFYSSRPRVTNSDLLNRFLHLCKNALPAFGIFQLWANSGRFQSKRLQPPIGDIQNRREVIREHFAKADEFFVATEIVRDAFLAQGYDSRRFKKLTFGIQQPGEEDKLALRDRYIQLKSGGMPLVIGFIGQIARHKGILDLLLAFEAANLENAELHVYGNLDQDVKAGPYVKAAAEKDPRIKLLGTFPNGEIYKVLASIHLLVIPSTWHENAPLILLNALASRTMLLVSSGKGLVEFVEDGRNGFIFPMGNVNALADRLRDTGRLRGELVERFNEMSPYDRSPEGYAREIESAYFRHAKAPDSISFPVVSAWPRRLINFCKVASVKELPDPGPEAFLPFHDDRFFLTAPLPSTRHLESTVDRHILHLSQMLGFQHAETIRLKVCFHQAGTDIFHYGFERRTKWGFLQHVTRAHESGIYEITIQRKVMRSAVKDLHWQVTTRPERARLSILAVAVLDENGQPVLPEQAEPSALLSFDEWLDLSCSPAVLDPRFKTVVAPMPPRELLSCPGPARTLVEYASKSLEFLTTVDALCKSPTRGRGSVLEVSWGVPQILRLLRDQPRSTLIFDEASRAWSAQFLPRVDVFSADPGSWPPAGATAFDRIIALHVLHYLPFQQWREFLNKLTSALAPGGELIFSIPSYRSVGRARSGYEVSSGFTLRPEVLQGIDAALQEGQSITLEHGADALPGHVPTFTICPLPAIQEVLPSSFKMLRHEIGGLEKTFDLLLLRRPLQT